jgi:hypothetical protein
MKAGISPKTDCHSVLNIDQHGPNHFRSLTMAYSVQLLPTTEESRIIRDALALYKDQAARNSDEVDVCWKFISQISISLTRRPGR